MVDRIKLVRLNDQSLFKDVNGLFRATDPNTQFEADASVKILTGALEGSNVNAIGEMTSLIDLQRQFEMQVKMMSTAEEMDKASDSLLRSS
ncbi:flagellar basal body rod protein FlgF [Vibrio cholerae]|uniref:Flagellar basal body rod protein FlgF n=1 Tax=Vibrio cholerae TaxID=666 RepID=A0A655XGY1_VIBCL|nr:flagellar basal body rod protein FlgF [Vibrio cholerae]CSD08989.1 flagellar basal body rod protein FlgF [Vibrio cholerae]